MIRKIFFLMAMAAAAEGHEFDRTSVEIFFVGRTERFTVADQGDCSAKITVKVADETIASIDPKDVTTVRQTFTVTALKAGTTTVHVEWHGIGQCVDDGSRDVTVVVRSGPDLLLSQNVFYDQGGVPFASPGKIRVGTVLEFEYSYDNIGDQPTVGAYSATGSLAPSLRASASAACAVTGQDFDCRNTTPIPAGGVRHLGGIAVLVAEEGLVGVTAVVTGGGDIRTSNNSSGFFLIDAVAARQAEALPATTPANAGGRR